MSGLYRPGGLAHMYIGPNFWPLQAGRSGPYVYRPEFLASLGLKVWLICIQARISGLFRPGGLAHMYIGQNLWPLQAGRSGPYVYRPEFLAASGREVWPICIQARISGLYRPGVLAHMYTGQNFWPLQAGRSGPYVYRPEFLASTGREVWPICIQARISVRFRPEGLAHMYIGQNFWPLQAGRSGPYVYRPEFLASSGREVWPICISARISGLFRPGGLAHMYLGQNFWPLQAGRSGPYVYRPEFLASSGREVWPICI